MFNFHPLSNITRGKLVKCSIFLEGFIPPCFCFPNVSFCIKSNRSRSWESRRNSWHFWLIKHGDVTNLSVFSVRDFHKKRAQLLERRLFFFFAYNCGLIKVFRHQTYPAPINFRPSITRPKMRKLPLIQIFKSDHLSSPLHRPKDFWKGIWQKCSL